MAELPLEGLAPDTANTRAFRLVGEFMFFWSTLEAALNTGICRLLGLSGVDAFVVTANVSVRDKIHILRTLTNFYSVNDERLAEAVRTMIAVAAKGDERNFLAHTGFIPHGPGGVTFNVVKAKGKFSHPTVVWSPGDFAKKNLEMADLQESLDKIVDEAARVRVLVKAGQTQGRNAPNAMSGATIEVQPEPNQLVALLRQFQPPQNSPPSNPKKAPRTRRAPSEKPKE